MIRNQKAEFVTFFNFTILFAIFSLDINAKLPFNTYCLERLTKEQQSKLFSHMINIGASFGHGCTSCTVNPIMRRHNQKTGDSSWVRRNYLVQFLKRDHFKDPTQFNFEFLSIVENDSRENFTTLFPERSLKEKPYRSRWVYHPTKDITEEMSLITENLLMSDQNFTDNADLIGGAFIRRNKKPIKKRSMIGHLYQTYPGKYYPDGARSKSIFDLGADSATIEKFFTNMTNRKVIKKLKKTKWSDPILRHYVKSTIIGKIRKMNPTLISAIDPIFWDSIPRMLYYAKKRKPKSFLIRFVTSKLFRKFMKIKLYSEEFENRKFEDFFEIMARLSVNPKTHRPVPIFMANLIDRPGKHIHDNQLEEVFGSLIGNYIYVLSGIDFSKEFIKWLKELEYEDKNDELLAINHYQRLVQMSIDELGVHPEELLQTEYILGSVGEKIRAKLFKLILKAFGDLPLMIKSLDQAFTSLNKRITSFTSKPGHNVYLIDAKEFYQNFHKLVHPKTMHPTVKGAKFMAKMFAEAPCK